VEAAATRKAIKYAVLERTHIFQPVAVENLGTMNASAYGFLAGLGRKISAISGDERETSYILIFIHQCIGRYTQKHNTQYTHKENNENNHSGAMCTM